MKIDNSSTVVTSTKVNTENKGSQVKPGVNKNTDAPEVKPKEAVNTAPPENEAKVQSNDIQAETRRLRKDQQEQQSQQAREEKVAKAVENIRGFIQENQRALDFDVAQEENRIIISVIDRQTNEVIRQIPPEDAIELAERIKKGDDISKSGLLINGNI